MSEARTRLEPPDISERGGLKGGQPQRSDERLYMQMFAYTGCDDVPAVAQAVAQEPVDAVVYADLNDPKGIGILTVAQDPNVFVDVVRPLLNAGPIAALQIKPDLTMFGRTYSLGYEPDLRGALIDRPRRTVLNTDWPWAIWYPLRRHGRFAQLPPKSSATSSPSTARSASASAPPISPTISVWRATASTAMTTTSSSV